MESGAFPPAPMRTKTALSWQSDSLENVPFLGTCGGFQYALIEFARNLGGIRAAAHQESASDAVHLVITRLACSLVEQTEELLLASGGIVRRAYGVERITLRNNTFTKSLL